MVSESKPPFPRLSITLEGAMNALSLNRDGSRVVVAGRNVLKIMKIDDSGFHDDCNLKLQKQASLVFSCLDACWSHVDDNLVASASSNGNIVVWNIGKNSKNKTNLMFTEHKRTVNSLSLHHDDPALLLSCSQDATIRLFDIRAGESVLTFESGTDSVRDVQFSPLHSHRFASVDESGSMKTWDYRSGEKPIKQFAAHNGPILGLDHHPSRKNVVATAGRDKLIKIWDLHDANANGRCTETIQTIAPVHRVVWRIGEPNHIASCSLVSDCAVYVWDTQRPYVPVAIFNGHSDVATGIQWKPGTSGQVFLSCSKDCKVTQHHFSEGNCPDDYSNKIGLSFSAQGDIALAISDEILDSAAANQLLLAQQEHHYDSWSNTSLAREYSIISHASVNGTISERQPHSLSLANRRHTSSMFIFSEATPIRDQLSACSMDWFVTTAKRYRLSGKCIGELCLHNAQVATDLNRPQIAQTWSILRSLFPCCSSCSTTTSKHASGAVRAPSGDNRGAEPKAERLGSGSHYDYAAANDLDGLQAAENELLNSIGQDDAPNDDDRLPGPPSAMDAALTAHNPGDIFFGDGDVSANAYDDYDIIPSENGSQFDWTLPVEAFEPQMDLQHASLGSSVPLFDAMESSGTNSIADGGELGPDLFPGSTAGGSDVAGPLPDQRSAAPGARKLLEVCLSNEFRIPTLNPMPLVRDMLYFYSAQADVQMCASVLLVFKDKFKQLVSEQEQERWFSAYIDLLEAFQLWTVAAMVIKFCQLPGIQQLSQQSTAVFVCCNRCQKPLAKGWYCEYCKSLTSGCSICHSVVRGIFVWCQVCCHGGHLEHLQQWFAKYSQCPTGCGHECELF